MITTDVPLVWRRTDYPVAFSYAPAWTPVAPLPEPCPGDRDVPYLPATPAKVGRRVELVAVEPITGKKLTTIGTALVRSYEDPLAGPISIKATASAWDPCWGLLGAERTMVRGRWGYQFPERGIDVKLGVDGQTWAKGALARPVDIGNDQVALEAIGIDEFLKLNTLGTAGGQDLYDGRGRFLTRSTAGWTFGPGVLPRWNETDPLDGDRSLQVSGSGYVLGPRLAVPGTRHKRQAFQISSAVRTDSAVVAFVRAYNAAGQVVAGGSTVNGVASNQDDEDWQQLVPKVNIPKEIATFYLEPVWLIHTGAGEWVDLDLVLPHQDTYTGSPAAEELAGIVGRIIKRLQLGLTDGAGRVTQTLLDAKNLGVRGPVIRSISNQTGVYLWHDSADVTAAEAIDALRSHPKGVDVWLDANTTLQVARRRGQDRRDYKLTNRNVLTPAFTLDPSAQIARYRAITGFGSGDSRVGITIDTPLPGYPVTAIAQVPDELSYRGGQYWAQGTAELAARRQYSIAATVSLADGAELATGDGVRSAIDVGLLAEAHAVRIGSRAFDFPADTCTLQCGLDPLVEL